MPKIKNANKDHIHSDNRGHSDASYAFEGEEEFFSLAFDSKVQDYGNQLDDDFYKGNPLSPQQIDLIHHKILFKQFIKNALWEHTKNTLSFGLYGDSKAQPNLPLWVQKLASFPLVNFATIIPTAFSEAQQYADNEIKSYKGKQLNRKHSETNQQIEDLKAKFEEQTEQFKDDIANLNNNKISEQFYKFLSVQNKLLDNLEKILTQNSVLAENYSEFFSMLKKVESEQQALKQELIQKFSGLNNINPNIEDVIKEFFSVYKDQLQIDMQNKQQEANKQNYMTKVQALRLGGKLLSELISVYDPHAAQLFASISQAVLDVAAVAPELAVIATEGITGIASFGPLSVVGLAIISAYKASKEYMNPQSPIYQLLFEELKAIKEHIKVISDAIGSLQNSVNQSNKLLIEIIQQFIALKGEIKDIQIFLSSISDKLDILQQTASKTLIAIHLSEFDKTLGRTAQALERKSIEIDPHTLKEYLDKLIFTATTTAANPDLTHNGITKTSYDLPFVAKALSSHDVINNIGFLIGYFNQNTSSSLPDIANPLIWFKATSRYLELRKKFSNHDFDHQNDFKNMLDKGQEICDTVYSIQTNKSFFSSLISGYKNTIEELTKYTFTRLKAEIDNPRPNKLITRLDNYSQLIQSYCQLAFYQAHDLFDKPDFHLMFLAQPSQNIVSLKNIGLLNFNVLNERISYLDDQIYSIGQKHYYQTELFFNAKISADLLQEVIQQRIDAIVTDKAYEGIGFIEQMIQELTQFGEAKYPNVISSMEGDVITCSGSGECTSKSETKPIKKLPWKTNIYALTENNYQAAIIFGHHKNAANLIKKGSVLDRDQLGRTPLHYAAAANSVALCTQLLARGISVDQPDLGGFTTIHFAARINATFTLNLLSLHGSVMKRNSYGYLPGDIAVQQGYSDQSCNALANIENQNRKNLLKDGKFSLLKSTHAKPQRRVSIGANKNSYQLTIYDPYLIQNKQLPIFFYLPNEVSVPQNNREYIVTSTHLVFHYCEITGTTGTLGVNTEIHSYFYVFDILTHALLIQSNESIIRRMIGKNCLGRHLNHFYLNNKWLIIHAYNQTLIYDLENSKKLAPILLPSDPDVPYLGGDPVFIVSGSQMHLENNWLIMGCNNGQIWVYNLNNINNRIVITPPGISRPKFQKLFFNFKIVGDRFLSAEIFLKQTSNSLSTDTWVWDLQHHSLDNPDSLHIILHTGESHWFSDLLIGKQLFPHCLIAKKSKKSFDILCVDQRGALSSITDLNILKLLSNSLNPIAFNSISKLENSYFLLGKTADSRKELCIIDFTNNNCRTDMKKYATNISHYTNNDYLAYTNKQDQLLHFTDPNDFSNQKLDTNTLKPLVKRYQNQRQKNIDKLSFRNSDINANNAGAIEKIIRALPNLRSLDLSKNKLGDEGIRIICKAISDNRSLIAINLSNNDITAAGMRMIAKAVENHPTLLLLELDDPNIDTGISAFYDGKHKKNPHLSLMISGSEPATSSAERIEMIGYAKFLWFTANYFRTTITSTLERLAITSTPDHVFKNQAADDLASAHVGQNHGYALTSLVKENANISIIVCHEQMPDYIMLNNSTVRIKGFSAEDFLYIETKQTIASCDQTLIDYTVPAAVVTIENSKAILENVTCSELSVPTADRIFIQTLLDSSKHSAFLSATPAVIAGMAESLGMPKNDVLHFEKTITQDLMIATGSYSAILCWYLLPKVCDYFKLSANVKNIIQTTSSIVAGTIETSMTGNTSWSFAFAQTVGITVSSTVVSATSSYVGRKIGTKAGSLFRGAYSFWSKPKTPVDKPNITEQILDPQETKPPILLDVQTLPTQELSPHREEPILA